MLPDLADLALRCVVPCVGVAIGGDDLPPGQWDDELSSWPEDRRKVAARRLAFLAVCAALIVLIILTIVFVGNDKKSSARVTTNETSSSTSTTIGFATSLPVAATATSLSGATTTTATTTSTTLDPGTTLETTTTAPATTTTLPPFVYTSHPKTNVVGQFSGGSPQCPPVDDPFTFDTPVPGTITITRQGRTASGDVDPEGNFDIRSNKDGVTDRYVGQTTQTSASGTYERVDPNCTGSAYTATWNFP
jgi:hypothetical protein